MHQYIPNTEAQKKAMLKDIGAADIEALFADIPSEVRQSGDINLPKAMSEMDVLRQLKSLAGKNVTAEDTTCFLGAGAYDHFIPSVIDQLLLRQEFYTAYTPYQPEISQGTLQAMFEYQTMICMLTGMDVSNASVYDGASAMGDAALVACAAAKRNEVLVAAGAHPQYRQVLKTYARFNEIKVVEFGHTDGQIDIADIVGKITENTAAIIVQTPNFFGIIKDFLGFLTKLNLLVNPLDLFSVLCVVLLGRFFSRRKSIKERLQLSLGCFLATPWRVFTIRELRYE